MIVFIRFIPAILLIFFLTSYDWPVLAQSKKGNLDSYLQNAIDNLPGRGSDKYQDPSIAQLTTWTNLISSTLDTNLSKAAKIADSVEYKVIEFTDTAGSKEQRFIIIEKADTSQNHWGIYVINPNPCREQLVIQAPHPKYDLNTGDQAVFCFKRLSARSLFLSGTHRCNHQKKSACSGTNAVCNDSSESYRISDMAHNVNAPFQKTTQLLHSRYPESVFVQLHGFGKKADDPYVIMSNGSRQIPEKDYASIIKSNLKDVDTTLTFKLAHIDTKWSRLIGFTNVQGRLINGSTNPCFEKADTTTGKFVQIEQEKSRLRADSNAWYKMYKALSETFKCKSIITLKNDREQKSYVHINPNPGNGKFIVQGEKMNKIQVINLKGHIIKEYKVDGISKKILQLNKSPNGLYIIRIWQRGTIITKKIIKASR